MPCYTDKQARDAFMLGVSWLHEANSGYSRSWTDLALLRQNWDGPIVLKGVQLVQGAHAAVDAYVNGIVVSNHGKLRSRKALDPCGLIAPLILLGRA
jgi:lactate 2-monooxygenase